MKMKKILVSMFLLFFALCLKANVSNAAEISAMERLDYWDVSKEYTITNQDATYHAYLSKDKKESWIFKADVAKDKKNIRVVIPDKVENAPVVIVGQLVDIRRFWQNRILEVLVYRDRMVLTIWMRR
mgnify:CR=1 FL=1